MARKSKRDAIAELRRKNREPRADNRSLRKLIRELKLVLRAAERRAKEAHLMHMRAEQRVADLLENIEPFMKCQL